MSFGSACFPNLAAGPPRHQDAIVPHLRPSSIPADPSQRPAGDHLCPLPLFSGRFLLCLQSGAKQPASLGGSTPPAQGVLGRLGLAPTPPGLATATPTLRTAAGPGGGLWLGGITEGPPTFLHLNGALVGASRVGAGFSSPLNNTGALGFVGAVSPPPQFNLAGPAQVLTLSSPSPGQGRTSRRGVP